MGLSLLESRRLFHLKLSKCGKEESKKLLGRAMNVWGYSGWSSPTRDGAGQTAWKCWRAVMAQQTGTILARMGHRCSERLIRYSQNYLHKHSVGHWQEGIKLRENRTVRESPPQCRGGEYSWARRWARRTERQKAAKDGKRRQEATGVSMWLPRFYWRHGR